ncbi:MAG: PTS transporter subunit IIC [Candidatus Onthomonas sp.]
MFLTGQVLLWEATITVVFGHYAGLNGVMVVLVGAVIGGLMCTLMPAAAQPYVSKITESDDLALGHLCTIGYLVTAWVAKLTARITGKSTDVEEMQMPKAFEFLQDTYLSVMAVMVPLLTIVAAIAGPEASAPYCGTTNYVVYGFIQGVQFAVGVYIVVAGVRLLLAEIVPAFRGIAMKIVPGAIPALDCPVLFLYSPNAVVVGFICTTIGSIIGMFLFPAFGLPVLLPGMMTNFFAGGTAGIFGNKEGGFRGCVISGIIHGLFITLLPALLAGMLTDMGFVNATCTDSDVILTGLFYGWVLKPIVGLFS